MRPVRDSRRCRGDAESKHPDGTEVPHVGRYSFVRRSIGVAVALIVLSLPSLRASAEPTAAQIEAQCRPFFGNACSEALGNWLPELPEQPEAAATPTTVNDELVDPAGRGDRRFLGIRGVYGGTYVVHGSAGGPPRAHVVYDPTHRIALYDDGCCSLFRIVVASEVAPPPKNVVERSLLGLHTARGIRLGQPPETIESIYGAAPIRLVAGNERRTTLSYTRTFVPPGSSSCSELTTFVFAQRRLIAWEYDEGC